MEGWGKAFSNGGQTPDQCGGTTATFVPKACHQVPPPYLAAPFPISGWRGSSLTPRAWPNGVVVGAVKRLLWNTGQMLGTPGHHQWGCGMSQAPLSVLVQWPQEVRVLCHSRASPGPWLSQVLVMGALVPHSDPVVQDGSPGLVGTTPHPGAFFQAFLLTASGSFCAWPGEVLMLEPEWVQEGS